MDNVLGGSLTLLVKILEKDIGSAALTGCASSLGGTMLYTRVSSSAWSRELVPSNEPCKRCWYVGSLCVRTGDSSALRAGDCDIELCRLGGCACELGCVGDC